MEHKLTFRTKKHNFYRTIKGPTYLFNITKKGDPMPVTGYFAPQHVLNIKGYKELNIEEVFDAKGLKWTKLPKTKKTIIAHDN